jgi:hypothetical protein
MTASTRPLTLGEILDRTVQLYRRSFLLMAGIAVPAAALIGVISGVAVLLFTSRFLALAQASQTRPAAPLSSQDFLVLGLAAALFFLIGIPLILGVFSMALAALNYAAINVNRGEPVTMRASYGYAFRHFWRHVGILFQQSLLAWVVPYFVFVAIIFAAAILTALAGKSGVGPAATVLLGILAIVGVIALLVVCILIWLRLSLAYPVSVAEDLKAWPSLKRSNFLSKGSRGRIFVMFLLVGVLTIVVSLMLAIPTDIVIGIASRKSLAGSEPPTQFLYLTQIVNLATGFLVRIFVMPIYAIALVLFYTDQRTRLEGYDIEQLMARAGWSELPPPPSPVSESAFPNAEPPAPVTLPAEPASLENPPPPAPPEGTEA